jgi:hypothetical protein
MLSLGAFLPASSGVESLPFWDMDPGHAWTPLTGLPPSVTVALALLALLGAACALLGDALDGRSAHPVAPILAGLGGAGVLIHAWTNGAAGLEHLLAGTPWIAGAASALGASSLAARPDHRRILGAILAGFIAMLLARSLLQILVEHRATIAEFARNREAILAARGWAADSSNALIYERRLSHPEASAWFGLSNVLASFAAALAAGLAALTIFRRGKGARAIVVPAVGALGAGAVLLLTASKGGVGAAVLSLGASALFARLIARRPRLAERLAPWLAPGLIAGVLALVAGRGLIGESIDEKSLLFRAHYAVGALRIWSEHPTLGVGPAGFQDAYAGAKLPFSPEIVASPHGVLFDWTATLGIFGLAWAALLLLAARRACLPIPEGANPPPLTRNDFRLVALSIVAVTLLAAASERALATPEASLARLAGLLGWIALAFAMLPALRTGNAARWMGIPLALSLFAHGQIEVTPVWVNSAPLFGLCLGFACPASSAMRPVKAATGLLPAAGCLLLAGVLGSTALPPILRWEHRLREAAEIMRPIGEARGELDRLAAGSTFVNPEAVAAGLSDRLGARVPTRVEAIGSAIELLRARSIGPAGDILADAVRARPAHEGTRSARIRLLMERAMHESTGGVPGAPGSLEEAIRVAEEGVSTRPDSVGAWDRLATVSEQAARMAASGGPGLSDFVSRARALSERAWLEVDARSPSSVRPAVRMMNLLRETGRSEEAREWAVEALRRDGLARLDPLTGLTDAERLAARTLSGESGVGRP